MRRTTTDKLNATRMIASWGLLAIALVLNGNPALGQVIDPGQHIFNGQWVWVSGPISGTYYFDAIDKSTGLEAEGGDTTVAGSLNCVTTDARRSDGTPWNVIYIGYKQFTIPAAGTLTASGGSLVIGTGHGTFRNDGLFDATQLGELRISDAWGTFVNNGTLQIGSQKTWNMASLRITNTGTIEVGDNSVIGMWDTPTFINQGAMTFGDGCVINVGSPAARLFNQGNGSITTSGTLAIQLLSDNDLEIAGVYNFGGLGEFRLQSTGARTQLLLADSTTFDGKVALVATDARETSGAPANWLSMNQRSLTITSGGTLTASGGSLLVAGGGTSRFTNQGVFDATQLGELRFTGSSGIVTNDGTLRIGSQKTWNMASLRVTNTGTIEVGDNSVVGMWDTPTFTNQGAMTFGDGCVITVGSPAARLYNQGNGSITTSGTLAIQLPSDNDLEIAGVYDFGGLGEFRLQSTGARTQLLLASSTTFDGKVALVTTNARETSGAPANWLGMNGKSLTIAAGGTLTASGGSLLVGNGGDVRCTFTNQGVFDVSLPGELRFSGYLNSYVVNNGMFRIHDNTPVRFSANCIDNAGGTISVEDAGSTFDMTGNSVYFLSCQGNTLANGTYLLKGVMRFNGANIVQNNANLTLDGASSRVLDEAGNDGLRSFSTNTASASFSLKNGRSFSRTGNFSNSGAVSVDAASLLSASGNYTQNSGITAVDGTLAATVVDILGGTLIGTGQIAGDLILENGGSACPGHSPGMLHVSGDLQLKNGSILNMEIVGVGLGQFDQIEYGGDLLIGGSLNLFFADGFLPREGDVFHLLDFAGQTTSTTIGPGFQSYVIGLDDPNWRYEFNYDDGLNLVSLSNAVPEPSTFALLGIAAISLTAFTWRQKRREQRVQC